MTNYPDGMSRSDLIHVGERDDCDRCYGKREQNEDDARDAAIERAEQRQERGD